MNEMRRLQAVQNQAAAAAARGAVAPPRMAIVDSYDPVNHLVRVRLQPEDILTGWMPWKALAAGNGWGFMAAPTPGSQATVTFEGGDGQIGFAHGGFFSDVDRPPTLQAGEMGMVHASGSFLKLLSDGSIQSSGAWTHTGTLHVTDKVTCDADVVASEVSLVSHLHADVYPGSGESGKPIAS